MDGALRPYEQAHMLASLPAGGDGELSPGTFGGAGRGEDYGVADGEDFPLAAEQVPLPALCGSAGQRDISCSWWPVGS